MGPQASETGRCAEIRPELLRQERGLWTARATENLRAQGVSKSEQGEHWLSPAAFLLAFPHMIQNTLQLKRGVFEDRNSGEVTDYYPSSNDHDRKRNKASIYPLRKWPEPLLKKRIQNPVSSETTGSLAKCSPTSHHSASSFLLTRAETWNFYSCSLFGFCWRYKWLTTMEILKASYQRKKDAIKAKVYINWTFNNWKYHWDIFVFLGINSKES